MVRGLHPAVLGLSFLLVAACSAGWVGIGAPLDTLDLGEGLFAPAEEFDFRDREAAGPALLQILAEPTGTARHLRAIRKYLRSLAGEEAAPRLRDLAAILKEHERTSVEAAFVFGLLALEEDKATREQDIKEISALLAPFRGGRSGDPWVHMVAAVLYGSFAELQGNWYDETLYAMSYGYDDAAIMLAAGSFLLTMDLSYGGDERLQWFVYLAFTRAKELAPDNAALRERIRSLVATNLGIAGYRPSRWLKRL